MDLKYEFNSASVVIDDIYEAIKQYAYSVGFRTILEKNNAPFKSLFVKYAKGESSTYTEKAIEELHEFVSASFRETIKFVNNHEHSLLDIRNELTREFTLLELLSNNPEINYHDLVHPASVKVKSEYEKEYIEAYSIIAKNVDILFSNMVDMIKEAVRRSKSDKLI